MWDNANVSARKARLPSDWANKNGQRMRILNRDMNACQWPIADHICGARATHVDHKVAGTSGEVPDADCWALCAGHHEAKTAGEGGRAKAARYRAPRRRRPHPGMVDEGAGGTPSPG